MSAVTSIEWTDRTWNCIRGCSLVSEGCRSCYAMKQAHRFSGSGKPYEGLTRLGPKGPTWTGKVVCDDSKLLEPLRWLKPARVFVNSMSDLFHEDVPFEFVAAVFGVMAVTSHHTYQVLTKRPERMCAFFEWIGAQDPEPWTHAHWEALRRDNDTERLHRYDGPVEERPWPLPNVWLGVSVENQRFADERIPILLQTPATVRFISAEPLLGPIDLHSPVLEADCDGYLDWVIVGGESGPGARPCALEWIQGIVAQCQVASVPVFVKQVGAYVVSEQRTMPASDTIAPERLKPEHFSKMYPDEVWAWRAGLNDRKGGDPAEWPEDFRVREFPVIQEAHR